MKGNNQTICPEFNLQWEWEHFKLLGVNFTTNLNHMTQANYLSKQDEVNKLFFHWSKRIITPIGKNVIIKSLALPKFNHLILSLPNPNIDTIKAIQNSFFKFLWNSGPDKIKRNVVIQNYENGGLRMTSLGTFMTSLKLTWIRRLFLYNSKYFTFVNKMYPFLSNVSKFGDQYLKHKLQTVHNNFWKDVFLGLIQLHEQKPRKWSEFCSLPVWHNSMFKIAGSTFCFPRYVNGGVFLVNDLLNNSGNLLSFNEFSAKYDINTNFLQYQNIIGSIRAFLNNITLIHQAQKEVNPVQPLIIKIINSKSKGCRQIYDFILRVKTLPTSRRKWNNELNLNANFNWNIIYRIPFNVTKDSNLQWFQYKVNHRILGTNYLLHKMGIKNVSTCSFCKNQVETIKHLFWDCQLSNSFWDEIKSWINSKCTDVNTNWTSSDIILGNEHLNKATLNLILLGKYTLYRCKLQNSVPSFNLYKSYVDILLKIQLYNAKKENNVPKFDKEWGKYLSLLPNQD